MTCKSITFLLPGAIATPGGGYKIILEHANNLAHQGHRVTIECPVKISRASNIWKNINYLRLYYKYKYIIGYNSDSWFPLHKNVQVRWIWSLEYGNVAPADIFIATEVRTSIYLNEYPIEPSRKYYFIQDYENWFISDEEVKSTYRYDMTKMAISHWLIDIVKTEEQECSHTPNGFNVEQFYITRPIEQKDKFTISMLNHWQERKDIPLAIAAIEIVRKQFPQLQVLAFGERDNSNLPDWFKYYRRPSDEQHLEINNRAAIYVGSSKIEGFGLTVGEAMLCGQAVACTDNRGYREMAKHNETALLSPVADAQALATNIIRLISDDNLRHRIAQNGHDYIYNNFSWDVAHRMFNQSLGL